MDILLYEMEIADFRERVAESSHPRELVIDILRTIQQNHGWVPDAGVELTAELAGLSPLQVEEVATYYDKIYRRPVGKRVIHVCDSVCCWSRGSEEVLSYLQEKLGIKPGETTADGIFTLLPTCCLGACGEAPAMLVGFNLYGSLTAEKIDEILDNERREALA